MRLFEGWNLYALLLISSFCFRFKFANGLHCHVCSSDNLEQCSTFSSPEELPTELCPADVASCYTRIEHGITVRGCMSHQRQNRCSNDSCAFCRSNNCNAQIFPEDRLSCLHCEGKGCVNQTNTIEVRHPCANYERDDGCYSIFSYDGSVAYRGCMSDYNSDGRDFCIVNFGQCDICSKRACNSKQLEYEEKLSCVKCSPDENSNCNVIDENTEATECASITQGYNNECYTYQNGSVSHRGCLYEAPRDIFNECNDIFSDDCSTCNQTDCNRKPIVNTDLNFTKFHHKIIYDGDSSTLTPCGIENCTELNAWERFCYKCDSESNPNCAKEVDSTMIEMCPFAEKDLGCFHMVTDYKVVRGCVVELKEEEQEKCMANDGTCKTCSAVGCNGKKNFLECFATVEPYTQIPEPYYTKAYEKACKKYNDQCFIQVLKNDTVLRGCVEDYAAEHDLSPNFLSENVPANEYQLCSEPLCNGRLDTSYCYSCNSSNPACGKNIRFNLLNGFFQKQCSLEAKPSGCYHLIKGDYVEKGCISDLEGEKRVKCKSDSENCKKCVGNVCNNADDFSRCIWSDHADYIGVSKLCRKYNDSCITHTSKDVIRRGCWHDWIEESLTGIDIKADCENSRLCEKCFTHDCNKQFIGREYCLSCSSNNDTSCARYPNERMREMCPFSMQQLGCYHRQENNVVQRGCSSSLNQVALSECQSSISTCKTCLGDSCNNKVNFQMCVDCSSDIDGEDCRTNTISLTERQCPNYSDQCYIRLEDGVITRNCTDDFLVTPKECDKSRNCFLCSGPRCNGRIIEPEFCITCDSVDDMACNSTAVLNEESYFKECPTSLKERGCFHFVDLIASRHIRGCVAKLSHLNIQQAYASRCQEFRTCEGPKCNSEPTLPKCLVCNSTEDSNCAKRPNSTHSKVCDSYKNQCFTLISGTNVTRGCLTDSNDDAKTKCAKDKVKCAIYPATDIVGTNDSSVNIDDTCIECDSKEDIRCRSELESFKGKICDHIESSSENTGCYMSIVGDNVTRGCIQDLEPDRAIECLSDSDTCKSCKGKDCNSKTKFQECYSCNSQSDPFCARNVHLANSEICKSYHSRCVTGIDRYGYIHRQCADTQSNIVQQFSNLFHVCEGDKCNDGVYPKNTLKCFQCNGDDNKQCDMMDIKSQTAEPCGIHSIHDQCFTYIGPDEKLFRGCLSDASNERLLCELVNEHQNGSCIKCNKSGCNNQPKFDKPKLSCMNCTDTEVCTFGLESANKSITCEKPVMFGDKETCFTHSVSDSKEVRRGCTLDVDLGNDWCKEEDGCITCSEPNCNIQNARFSWCAHCESGIKGDCAVLSKLEDYIGQCGKSPYPFNKRGCFIDVKNGTVTRGCIADLSDEEYENCDKQEECTLCVDDKCNKEAISSSIKVSASILLMAASFILLRA